MKTATIIHTNDLSIDNAEKALDIKYPELIRKKLKQKNGFDWGGFEFYPVFDEEDKQQTSDDVVKENNNPMAGWQQHIPADYVCIAASDLECLLLNKNKDGKIYYYLPGHNAFESAFDNAEDLAKMLDEQDLFIKLDLPTDEKYFIKLMLYSILDNKQLLLMFHDKPKLEDPKNALVYCSKVNPGQRLSEVLRQEIKQITGYEQYVLNKIYNDGTDFDKHGSELTRYGLVLQVSHFETKGKRFAGLGDAYMSWVDEEKLD